MGFLKIKGLTKKFGGLSAVSDLDLGVPRGQIFGLIGPNGAGKSTALNLVDGTLMPSSGEITFNGDAITRLPPHQRAKSGIARVFQDNLFFNSFSVLENVIAGYYLQSTISLRSIFFKYGSRSDPDRIIREKAMGTLDLVGLMAYADELAVNLPHGRQRLLCLAIALATQPKLLLLDEPLTGMNAQEVEEMLRMIRTLRDKKSLTCIIIEHNLKAVMGLCDYIAVLNFGSKLTEGTPEEVVENPEVLAAYLGEEENNA